MQVCAICKKRNFKKEFKVKDRIIFRCRNCGILAVSPLPSNTGVKKVIDKVSKHFYDEYHDEYESYYNYFVDKFRDLKRIKRKGLLVDVGCGPGVFLEVVSKDKNWQPYGLDLSSEAIKIAKQKKLSARVAALTKTSFGKKKFDVITAFQLIEHDRDPLSFLTAARAKLKDGGVLMMTTPSATGFLARVMRKSWFGYHNHEHLYFFSPESLSYLVKKAGFEIVLLKTEHGRVIKPFYVWGRLTNYYYTEKNLLNSLLYKTLSIFKIFDKFIHLREPWVNVYLVARKK